MDRYNRAWRDPRSPLTPITPLTTRVFNFDNVLSPATPTPRTNTFQGLKRNLLTVPKLSQTTTHHSRSTKNYSEDFRRLRSVFSPCAQSTVSQNVCTTPKLCCQTTQKENETLAQPRIKREFKRASPVNHPSLSPRVSSLLSRTGNEHLTELFTRQEIDLQVLIQMTFDELESLGVRGVKELKLAIDLMKFAKKFF
ncbi:uncharacterized protein LOC6558167 [Drosophila grimshawi]|uniref:GH16934 n=1 Tax=Drosophila grimshawi TaxID=7222 RepID=B4IY15_DROGR|nr:uncharacterized protein LOC6558167 [Drosophila grimshawi]EDV97558.1 GH16934 [Drosophila grimshawi]